jgi:hypothetical protein
MCIYGLMGSSQDTLYGSLLDTFNGSQELIFVQRKPTPGDNPGIVKNSMAPRAREAISLTPAANTPGAFHVFLFDTQEIVVRSSWIGDVPFTAAIVDHINQIARSDEIVVQEVDKKGGGKKVRFAYQPTAFGCSLPVGGYDVDLSHIPRGVVVPVDAPMGNDTNETSPSDPNESGAPDDPPHSDHDDDEQDIEDARVDESHHIVQGLQDGVDTLEQPRSNSDHPDHSVAARTRYKGQRDAPCTWPTKLNAVSRWVSVQP